MRISHALPVAAGTIALLATSAIFILHVILAGHVTEARRVRALAGLSAALEGVLLSVLSWLFSTYFIVSSPDRSKRFVGLAFGISVMTLALASVISVATIICLSSVSKEDAQRIFDVSQKSYMAGMSVALALAFAAQVIFIVSHFVLARIPGHGVADSLHTTDERPSQMEVRSVRYDQTKPHPLKPTSMFRPPGSSGGKSAKSATETMDSLCKSITSVTRPLSTRLLLSRERSSSSTTSNGYRERESIAEDGFDSWDTSGVDPQNRQAALQSTSPSGGPFLETIPASPTNSRSPSPNDSLSLDPPRTRNRSRSYSPAGSQRVGRAPALTQSDGTEAHIHPLFRSDSPTPPPLATPGTMVLASPNAGQVISDRQSIRSLHRMRSGSLPTTPSPLSRQGSFDEFAPLRPAARDRERETPPASILEAPEEEERKLTPPIPEWILSAGARSSLSDYSRRKGREEEKK